jgi:hypothetical protein
MRGPRPQPRGEPSPPPLAAVSLSRDQARLIEGWALREADELHRLIVQDVGGDDAALAGLRAAHRQALGIASRMSAALAAR